MDNPIFNNKFVNQCIYKIRRNIKLNYVDLGRIKTLPAQNQFIIISHFNEMIMEGNVPSNK